MKKLLLIFAILYATTSFGQNVWKQAQVNGKELDPARVNVIVQQLYEFDLTQMKQSLQNAPDRFSGLDGITITIPNVEGKSEQYTVYESSNFEPELQAQYPDIRSYVGFGIDDRSAYLRFSISSKGIQTMVLRADKQTEFIEPYTLDRTVYAVYNARTRKEGELPFECQTHDTEAINSGISTNRDALASNQLYKTFRLALSCTGEYTTYHGGTVAGALAAMNATMTRVNGVMEKDLAVHFNIIANNSAVIYTNASTDPYSIPSVGTANANYGTLQGWNLQLQNTLTTILNNNYDIGHLFGASGGGGNAGCIGCICVDDDTTIQTDMNKGSGYTSPGDGIPQGDTFDIDFVAHEMGHQLGANHTFSHANEGSNVQVEPGSGSTIMGYAGVTNYNVQMNSDDYFTYRSISQIETNLSSKPCSVNTPITNQLPTITVGPSSANIPKGTPFKLEATATDPESNVLTYCWEQNNSGTAATVAENSIAFPTKAAGPNFRSFLPVSTGVRYFPAFSKVLSGNIYDQWESLSDVARTFVFTMTVRDVSPSASQTKTASKAVIVSGTAGPFKVTYPTLSAPTTSGGNINVTWDVATTNAAPFNVSNVKISLSTDGGVSFTTLLASTANDGTESITLPNVTTIKAMIMIESIGNVFYCVSPKFLIGYTLTPGCINNYTGASLVIPDGTGANVYGAIVEAPITISSPVTIEQVKVNVNISHSYIQDLVVYLVAPSGTAYTLWNRQCVGEDGLVATFTANGSAVVCGSSPISGNILPNQSLAALTGTSSAGTWKLRVKDGYNGDTGSITGWGIEFCNSPYTIGISDYSFDFFNIFPNPSDGVFNISLNSNNTEKATIQLFDMSGRLITQNIFDSSESQINTSVDYSNVSEGIYLMKISKGNEIGTKQIVIE